MRNTIIVTTLLAAGCSFMARGPDRYRDDTQAVLDTRGADIKGCYDKILEKDDAA